METTAEVSKPRYSVSRKGMGGRKAKYTVAQLNEVLDLVKAGKSLVTVAKEKSLPYVSVRSALIREGLLFPKKRALKAVEVPQA